VGESAGEAARGGGCVPCAHDRDGLSVEQVEVALRDDQRRGVVELRQKPRVEALPNREISRAELLHLGDFSLGSIPAEQLRGSTAASARQIRNGRKRGGRVAEARDQLAIGDRPDPGGTDQPDALD
jgi:hypothetical protein